MGCRLGTFTRVPHDRNSAVVSHWLSSRSGSLRSSYRRAEGPVYHAVQTTPNPELVERRRGSITDRAVSHAHRGGPRRSTAWPCGPFLCAARRWLIPRKSSRSIKRSPTFGCQSRSSRRRRRPAWTCLASGQTPADAVSSALHLRTDDSALTISGSEVTPAFRRNPKAHCGADVSPLRIVEALGLALCRGGRTVRQLDYQGSSLLLRVVGARPLGRVVAERTAAARTAAWRGDSRPARATGFIRTGAAPGRQGGATGVLRGQRRSASRILALADREPACAYVARTPERRARRVRRRYSREAREMVPRGRRCNDTRP
jgi:hypothetical protein